MIDDTQHKIVKRVHERITQFPDTHAQSEWFVTREMVEAEEPELGADYLQSLVEGHFSYTPVVDVELMNSCGTVACVAGHAMLAAYELGIEYPLRSTAPVPKQAACLMGLSVDEGEALFHWADEDEALLAVSRAADRGTWVGAFDAE